MTGTEGHETADSRSRLLRDMLHFKGALRGCSPPDVGIRGGTFSAQAPSCSTNELEELGTRRRRHCAKSIEEQKQTRNMAVEPLHSNENVFKRL